MKTKLNPSTKIYVAGHRGLVGSAIWHQLESRGFTQLIGRTHAELDLLDPVAVRAFFDSEQPEVVILAAVKRGLTQGAYAARILREQIAIAENLDWPIPENLTNKTVDDEARRMLRKLKTGQ